MSNSTTIAEITSALRVNKKTVKRRAKKEAWSFVTAVSNGGYQHFYPLENLPAEIQQSVRYLRADRAHSETLRLQEELAQLAIQSPLSESADQWAADQADQAFDRDLAREQRKASNAAKFAAIPDGKKKRGALARQFFVQAYLQFYRSHSATHTREAARKHVVEQINHGEWPIPPEYIEFIPQYRQVRVLNEKTLQRWELTLREEGAWGLVDAHGHRKNQSVIATNRELYEVVLAILIRHPHVTASKIRDFLRASAPQLDVVSVRSIQRFKTDWIEKNAQLWMYLTNPDRWKNVHMAAVGSQHERVNALNQLWEMDSTPADWMLQDGRHSVVGVIDLYSRRLKFYVAKTSSGYAVCQAFRAAVLAWGLPDGVRTDNGQDYVSNHFNTVLSDLNINHILCLPFASEEKGTVERAMRTMSHGILDLLPGFIGHSVAERKLIEARKSFADRIMKNGDVVEVAMSAKELQEKLDQWTEHLYGKNSHSGLGGKSPWEVANAWRHPIKKISDERALDALLVPVAKERTITKGAIRHDDYKYTAPELTEHSREKVQIKVDEHDIGRVYVYLHDKFLCVAECPELLGISRAEKAAAIKHHQKKFLREKAAELKALEKNLAQSVPETILQYRIEQSENVTELPKRAEVFTTPALEEAARAVAARDGIPVQEPTAEEIEERQEVVRKILQLNTPLTAHQDILRRDDPREIFKHWQNIDARLAAQQAVTDEERSWHACYQDSVEYKTALQIEELRKQYSQNN